MSTDDDHAKLIGKRIKARRKELKLTQEALTEKCGWESQGRISNYERGVRKPDYQDAVTLAESLKLTIDELIWGQNTPNPDESLDLGNRVPLDNNPSNFVLIPLDNDIYSGGNGSSQPEAPQFMYRLSFRKDWFEYMELDETHTTCALVYGDSMAGQLKSRDVALIDKRPTKLDDVESGKIYAIRYNGSPLIKRLIKQDFGDILMVSDNKPLHQDKAASAEELEIIGRIVWRGGEVS